MRIFHLSHTDLDGYSAQFVTKHIFQDIKFYNSNYGKEINEKFNLIIQEVGNAPAIILITDLNLTIQQCQEFDEMVKSTQAKIFLLDHHQTGEQCADEFNWYYLDNTRSATAITYDFFAKMPNVNLQNLKQLRDVVNSIDIWLSSNEEFEMGKVCMSMVSNAKEINKTMFDDLHREYIFFLIQSAMEYFQKNSSYIELDENIHKIKKQFFKIDKDDTLGNLVAKFIIDKLSNTKDKFTIKYGKHLGCLSYSIGSTSVIGNEFLLKNPQFSFFMDITPKKSVSIRANGKLDVSVMAKELFNGGGHKNASGGVFLSFKDSYIFENIKMQIQNLLEEKCKKDNCE